MSGFIGYPVLTKKLRAVGGSPEKVSKKVIRQTVTIAAGDARALVPVSSPNEYKSGNIHLRDTISERFENNGMIGIIVTSSSGDEAHGEFVEFGTGARGEGSPSPPKYDGGLVYTTEWPGMAARPFMFPASEAQREEYPKRMRYEMMKEIKQINKGQTS